MSTLVLIFCLLVYYAVKSLVSAGFWVLPHWWSYYSYHIVPHFDVSSFFWLRISFKSFLLQINCLIIHLIGRNLRSRAYLILAHFLITDQFDSPGACLLSWLFFLVSPNLSLFVSLSKLDRSILTSLVPYVLWVVLNHTYHYRRSCFLSFWTNNFRWPIVLQFPRLWLLLAHFPIFSFYIQHFCYIPGSFMLPVSLLEAFPSILIQTLFSTNLNLFLSYHTLCCSFCSECLLFTLQFLARFSDFGVTSLPNSKSFGFPYLSPFCFRDSQFRLCSPFYTCYAVHYFFPTILFFLSVPLRLTACCLFGVATIFLHLLLFILPPFRVWTGVLYWSCFPPNVLEKCTLTIDLAAHFFNHSLRCCSFYPLPTCSSGSLAGALQVNCLL